MWGIRQGVAAIGIRVGQGVSVRGAVACRVAAFMRGFPLRLGVRGLFTPNITARFNPNLKDEMAVHSEKPVSAEEENFYKQLVVKRDSSLLIVGGVRRYLPIFRGFGLNFHGVESSVFKIRQCRDIDPTVELFHQSLENLNLPQRYGSIFISPGTFHLVDASLAIGALKSLKGYLYDGGTLFIPLSRPYPTSIDHVFLPRWVVKDAVAQKDGIEMRYFESVESRPLDGQVTKFRVELLDGKHLIDYQEGSFSSWWYYQSEFRTMLLRAGFNDIVCFKQFKNETADPSDTKFVFVAS